jgi:hypothetical protein
MDAQTGSLSLKSALPAFYRIQGSHTGEALADATMGLLDRADITVKVSRTCYIIYIAI